MEGFIMKKKILAIFLVVAMVAALAVGLTACKKDNGKKMQRKSLYPHTMSKNPITAESTFRTSKSVCFACMTKTARTTKTSS